ncbi:MAG: GAF domain-containing protein [Fimbriimonadaceae bacterium]|nr:GAF domain-containing protein [Fimbriimonadaceae bacterium]
MAEFDFEALADDRVPSGLGPLEQAQRALGWSGLRHDVVMSLFRLATEWLEEEPLLTNALHILEDHLRAEAGSVIMLDRHHGDLYFAAATGPVSGDLKSFRLDRTEGIAGWCMETGKVIRINDVAAEGRWHSQVSRELGFDVRQIIAAPIKLRNRVIGCVELINKQHAGDEFLPDDEALLLDAAECVGILFALRGRRPGQ